jgi:hypothetical protein
MKFLYVFIKVASKFVSPNAAHCLKGSGIGFEANEVLIENLS